MLDARNLHKYYKMGHSSLHVLRGASLHVKKGEFLVIRGASGSGKSTLLHLLGTLDIPDQGDIAFAGKDLFSQSDAARRHYRSHSIGFVFQFYHLLPECNVLENVMMPRLVACSAWRWRSLRRRARCDAMAILEHVGLSDRWKHRPNELSGGERQRVAIARALVNDPVLLLADEPTGNLDTKIGGEILDLLTGLNEAGQTIVMVTHDDKVASRAHRGVYLVEGVIQKMEDPGDSSIVSRPLEREVAS